MKILLKFIWIIRCVSITLLYCRINLSCIVILIIAMLLNCAAIVKITFIIFFKCIMSFFVVIKIFSNCWIILLLIKSFITVDVSIKLQNFLIFAIEIENCIKQTMRINDWRFFLSAIDDDEIRKNVTISDCDFNNEFNLNAKFNNAF